MELHPTPLPRPKTSVKIEFSLWVMLLVLATAGTLTWFILRQERDALVQEVTRRGLALTQYLATHSIDPFLTNDKLTLATLVADVMKNEDMVYALIVDRDSRVVAADKSELIDKPYIRPPGIPPLYLPEPFIHTWHHPDAGWVIDIGIPLILQAKTKIGEIHLGISHSTIQNVVSHAWRNAGMLVAIFLLAGLVGSVVLVTLMLRPVSALTRGAQAIGLGNLDYQIPPMRPNELGQLAETFNRMTRELKIATEQALEQERLQKELQVAQQIQQKLLPKQLPEIPGYSFGALYRAAKEVGGDYYDFLRVGKDHLGLAVADVCGKGVPAALLMSVARSILKTIAPGETSPLKVLKELNRLLVADLSRGLFITLFYAVINVKNRTMTFTSAGHNPVLVWQAQKRQSQLLELRPPCLPLGVDGTGIFERLVQERTITLKAGDAVILYTDGLTEAWNDQREEFGMERLKEAVAASAGLGSAADMIQGIDRSLIRFCGELHQNDDLAVVTLKVD
ncbi:MAG: SpoIIE family protein phosphatase [candidate division FCPU426 bacterium]